MSEFASFDGVRIAYDEWGPTGEPVPVVLHHGFAADSQINWIGPKLVERLVREGRRVVTLDARGHGRSEKPHDAFAYANGAMVRDLMALVDLLAVDEIDLVGYSMGTLVSLEVTTKDPRVRSLVAGGIGGAIVSGAALNRDAIAHALRTADITSITYPAALAFRLFADATKADKVALAEVTMSLPDHIPGLETIIVPTLVIVGVDDPIGARPEVLAAAIPGARLELVPGNHLSAVVEPAFADAIVAFLRDVASSAARA